MDTLRDKNYLEDLWKTGKAHGRYGYESIILAGKKVLITGHTGFKELAGPASAFGADVTGYSLLPPTNPSLFEVAQVPPMISCW